MRGYLGLGVQGLYKTPSHIRLSIILLVMFLKISHMQLK